MTRTRNRRATTIAWLLIVSGAGVILDSHSTAAEPSHGSVRRTAAGQRAEPSVSRSAASEQFNRTVFGPRPKAAPPRVVPADQFVPTAHQPPQPTTDALPGILPADEPQEVALQPNPLPPKYLTPPSSPPAALPPPRRIAEPLAPAAPRMISQPQASEIVPVPDEDDETPAFKPPKFTPIGDVSTSIDTQGKLPRNYAAVTEHAASQQLAPPGELPRTSAPFYSTPRVADFTHRPLYFEEKALERNGRTIGLAQPLVSFVHFFGTVPLLPYKMGEKPPSTPMYTGDGIHLPSDNATVRQRVRGVMTAAGTAVGLNAILP